MICFHGINSGMKGIGGDEKSSEVFGEKVVTFEKNNTKLYTR